MTTATTTTTTTHVSLQRQHQRRRQQHHRRRLHCGFTTVLLLLLSTTTIPTAVALFIDSLPILWSDEFEHTASSSSSSSDGSTSTSSPVNPDYWTPRLGNDNSNSGELQIYTANLANLAVHSTDAGSASLDRLEITALRQDTMLSSDNNGGGIQSLFTSGRIDTRDAVTLQYGTLSARIRVPDTDAGLWPAFGTLASNASSSSAAVGEINVMSVGQGQAIAQGVANQRVVSAAHWQTSDGSKATMAGWLNCPDLTTGFYVYTLDWNQTHISTYLDDRLIWSMDISPENCLNCEEFHQPHYIVLNLAVGGAFTTVGNASTTSNGCEIATTSSSSGVDGCGPLRTMDDITAPIPATMLVDYVRIYDNNAGVVLTVAPRSGPKPAPTPAPTILSDSIATPVLSPVMMDSASKSPVTPAPISPVSFDSASRPPGEAPIEFDSVSPPLPSGPVGFDSASRAPAESPIEFDSVSPPLPSGPVSFDSASRPPAEAPIEVESVSSPPPAGPVAFDSASRPPAEAPIEFDSVSPPLPSGPVGLDGTTPFSSPQLATPTCAPQSLSTPTTAIIEPPIFPPTPEGNIIFPRPSTSTGGKGGKSGKGGKGGKGGNGGKGGKDGKSGGMMSGKSGTDVRLDGSNGSKTGKSAKKTSKISVVTDLSVESGAAAADRPLTAISTAIVVCMVLAAAPIW